MTNDRKTVFFGPFVGEFGWELTGWHGWVKRLCGERYASYHKIACSFPGRYPFYPAVDEFWPLPKKFLENRMLSHGYITDYWIKGLPRLDNRPFELPEVLPLVNDVMKNFKKKLPRDTEFIIPWELRYDEEDKRYYGVSIPENPKSNEDFITYGIPLSNQILEELQPTPKGLKLLKTMIDPKKQLIAIFPRHRLLRPDKDWSKEKYETLIYRLQREFPQFKLAVLGEPGGAYFVNGVPYGCVDLIHINPKYRLDVQIAALKQSVVAIGGQSGAINFALAAGCRVLSWGEVSAEKCFQRGNYLRSELLFYSSKNPSVDLIMTYARHMLGHGELPLRQEIKRLTLKSLYRLVPDYLERSKALEKLKIREIIKKLRFY